MVIFWTITVVLCLLVLLFFIKNKETTTAATLRAKANRKAVQLTHGKTAYETYGQPENPVVVMVHGALVPSIAFSGLADHIASKGFFVLTYDHYGRGLSDRLSIVPTMDLYQQQLSELLAQLVPDREVILMGYSLGGAIATVFTANHSTQITQLILIAPLVKDPSLAALKLFKLPLFGEWLFRVLVCDQIIKKSSEVFKTNVHYPQLREQLKQQYRIKGTERMIIKGFKQHQVLNFMEYYQSLEKMDLPILLIAGKVDQLIPIRTIQEARIKMGQHQYQAFDNDHDLIQVKRIEILETIEQFLDGVQ